VTADSRTFQESDEKRGSAATMVAVMADGVHRVNLSWKQQ
jgi:hypothetical protein